MCSSSKKIGIFDLSQYHDSVNGYSARNMKWIDINRVKAAVKSFGTLFWDGRGDPRYMVPADQHTSSIFAAGLWVGGYDDNNTLYFSGERYNQQGYDYYPGPLTVDEYGEPGTIDYPVMASFNRVWKIDRHDLGVFAYNHYNNIPYDVPADIAQWPGNGPQGCSALLAPFIDNNEDGLYNIADGDMPDIIGDQMLWWVTNDVAAPHTESGGNSMGIEVQYSLYAYVYVNPPTVYSDLVNYQTWLRIKLINRSDRNYHSVYMGLFVDGDLGNPTDDYVGSDVEHNSFYFYNGDHFDEDYMGNTGYGVNPPVQTITVLKSPLLDPNGIDDDGDGTIDNEQTGMSRFMYYNYAGGVPATTDPNSAESCYSYLTGYWLDGQPLCYGGTGHPSGGGNSEIPCNYMFPGDTDPNFNGTPAMLVGDWSEETSGNPSGDRRGVCSMGPVHLDSNEVVEIDVLFGFIPYSQQRSGKFDYTPKLDTLISWYRNGNIPSNYAAANQLPVPVHTRAPLVLVYPNPASDYVIIQTDDKMSKITLCDVGGNELTAFQPGSSFFRISCAALASGVYYLKIETAGASNVRKLVITD